MRPTQTIRVAVYFPDGQPVEHLKVPIGTTIRDLEAFYRRERGDQGLPYFYIHGSALDGLSDALSPDTVISHVHRTVFLVFLQSNMKYIDTRKTAGTSTYMTYSWIQGEIGFPVTDCEVSPICIKTPKDGYMEFGIGDEYPRDMNDIIWYRAGSPIRSEEINLSYVNDTCCVRYNSVTILNLTSTSPLWLWVKLFPDTSVEITRPDQSGGNPDGITVVVPPTKEKLSQMSRTLTRRERQFLLKSLTGS